MFNNVTIVEDYIKYNTIPYGYSINICVIPEFFEGNNSVIATSFVNIEIYKNNRILDKIFINCYNNNSYTNLLKILSQYRLDFNIMD